MITLFGDDLLVASNQDDEGGANVGAAYLFDGGTGEVKHVFRNPTPALDDRFGFSIAVVDGNILIGALSDNTNGSDAGAAYLYDGTTFELLNSFLGRRAGENFGHSVAAFGDDILIGATRADTETVASAGVVYLFEGLSDGDGDGVPDDEDLCPATPAGDIVDGNGCSDSQVDSDGDGFCDPGAPSPGPAGCLGSDECPDSDLAPTIVIDGEDTDVENDLLDGGCTLSDLIDDVLAADPEGPVSELVQLLVDLKRDGIITGRQMGRILQVVGSP